MNAHNPSAGNDNCLPFATILQAGELHSCAYGMPTLISECDPKPADSTAYVVALRIAQADKLLGTLVEAKA